MPSTTDQGTSEKIIQRQKRHDLGEGTMQGLVLLELERDTECSKRAYLEPAQNGREFVRPS
jgi:hypothetical protein